MIVAAVIANLVFAAIGGSVFAWTIQTGRAGNWRLTALMGAHLTAVHLAIAWLMLNGVK